MPCDDECMVCDDDDRMPCDDDDRMVCDDDDVACHVMMMMSHAM